MIENNLVFENARIGFRNFSGKEGQFNPAGRRNFCVFLESNIGKQLERDGWLVRWLKPRDPDDDLQAYMQVSVRFTNIPPKIIVISNRNKMVLDENTVNILDWAEIENVDLIIRPYNWEVNGKKGVKAYVKSMYVTLAEDEFANKYRDYPDSANLIADIDDD